MYMTYHLEGHTEQYPDTSVIRAIQVINTPVLDCWASIH